MYWLLRIFKKTNKQPFELYYRGWHWSGMGQSFLQSFFFFFSIPLYDFVARTWDFSSLYPVIFPICSRSMSVKPSWYEGTGARRLPLGRLQMTLWGFLLAWQENPFVTYVNVAGWALTRDVDLASSWLISLCSVDTHQIPEFCFLGKYCNSGLKSPSESLEPKVTLSQAYNAYQLQTRLRAAKVMAWHIPVHITSHNQYALSGSLIFILLSLY